MKGKKLEIILATKNPGKIREVKDILKDLNLKILSLQDFPQLKEIKEEGSSYKENAIKKAETVARQLGRIALADDSGLEVDVLGGEPGVRSARFVSPKASDKERNLKLLELLKDIPPSQRTARFKCVIALSLPEGRTITRVGCCPGLIALEPKGESGFGYDPIFFLPQYGKSLAELGTKIKNRVSHRAKALQKMKVVLKGILAKV